MFLRIFSGAFCVLALGACGAATQSPEPEGDNIDCAIGAGSEYSSVCTLERVSDSEIVVHHPDGGFRRMLTGAEGVQAADGSDELRFTQDPVAGDFEVFVAEDRYYLPKDLVLTE